METESLNWFRFAKCLVTVGTEVLQRLLKFNIQTCCFSEYHKLWLDKVNVHCQSIDLKVLWDSFDQQCRVLDASSQQILQSLLIKWKSNCAPTAMEIRQQLSFLKDWEDDIHDFITKYVTQKNTLEKWSTEIQILGALNTSLLTLVKQWTQDYINLCQVDQMDLVHITERHHERTNNYLTDLLRKLEFCMTQLPGELGTVLKTSQHEEVTLLHVLQRELQAFFISWQPKIDQLLDLWITFLSSSPHKPILNNFVTDVKNLLPMVHQTCQTELQNICRTWHINLRKMLSEWDNQLLQVVASTGDLAKTWYNDLHAFSSTSDQQIRDFLDSKRPDLQKLKSRKIITNPQWSLLYPSHGYIDLQQLDVTILSTLHRNVFPICPPELGWSGQILETDHSLGADLMRLRKVRNDYFGHIPNPTMTTCEFEKVWTILDASLHRLSTALDEEFKEKVSQKITQLKSCPFDSSEDMKLKLELMKQMQGNILELNQSGNEKMDKCLSDVQIIKEGVEKLPQYEAFKEMIDLIKERMHKMEKTIIMVEKSISSQKINRCKLDERIDLMRARIELHERNHSDVHVRTRALDHARDILLKEKHIVLKGKPGEGKTYLALSLVADLIEMDRELAPVEINNTHEWDEMVDTRLQLVVFLDDVLGKYGISETDLDRWKKISEVIHPRFSGSSIFLVVCIRTQIASLIKLSLRRNEAIFMFNSNVLDISNEPNCLTNTERNEMLKKYPPQCVDRNENSATKDIVEMENVIGFAQNCKLAGSIQNLSVDLKEIFSNNMFLIEEIRDISRKSPEIYTFLVLLMLSGGCLPLENKQKELNNKLKTLSDYCGLRMLNIKEMKYIGHSLCGTLLEYIKQRETFKFQHDSTETAVFVSFGKDYPDVILEHCSLKQLSKMCCVANDLDQVDGEEFLSFKIRIHDDHFRTLCDRFNEGLESGRRDSFKSIAEGLVWKNQSFVDHFSDTMALRDNVLNFLSKTDHDGHSLLIHLINTKSTLAVKSIIKNISQYCLQDNDSAARQLLLATTNACLTEEKTMLNDFIKLREKVDDFVMLAAASTGNVSVMETLVHKGGNINSTISTEQRGTHDLSNVIKNCISYPKISRYHHDINLFHIACHYGRTDMVNYLMNNFPELVHRTSNIGRTAVHFLAYTENLELLKTLSAEQINIKEGIIQPIKHSRLDILNRDNNGANILHIASVNNNLQIVKYLIESNPSLTLQNDKNGWTAIHCAAAGGSAPVIEALIQAGLDINARTNDDRHVLHIAAQNDNLPIVKYLVENRPSLTLQNDKNGWTAIHYAAAGGSAPVIEALKQAGLDLNARTNDDCNVLHIAVANDNLLIVKYLIENNPILTLQNDKNGWSAIHYTAARGSVPVIEALIQARLDLNARTNDDSHVLHIAALNDNLPIVRYLIENNHSLLVQNDKDGWTAIHYASAGGSVHVIEALKQAGLDLNARTNDDSHVLHIAALNDYLPIVKYLIKNSPSLTLQNDKNEWSAIHCAAAGGSASVIEDLKQAGLDLNARTNDDCHVVHIAAVHDKLPTVQYLIENYPSIARQNNKNGQTPIHCAAARGSAPVIEALIQAGLDINARTNDDRHVLHIAAQNDNLPIVKYLIENNHSLLVENDKNGLSAIHYAAGGGSVPVIEDLIQAGLDLNARTNDDRHVLHIAARHDNLPIVKYLVEKSPSLTLQNDKNGWSALHYAAAGSSAPVIAALKQAGLDLNARTNDNRHVLHIAALNDNLPIVKYLVENNPTLTLQNDKNGWSAIHYAAARGSAPVIAALKQAGLDLNARTNDDRHVLHIAALNDNLPIVKYLVENNPTLTLQNDKNGWSAIHYAAAGGSAPVIEALKQAGLDLNARTNDDCNVLHIAAVHDKLPTVQYLIENYPSIARQNNKNGQTPIHCAAQGGSAPVIEALIQAGLDINARTNDDRHVLHIAAQNDNLPIVKYLVENNPSLRLQNNKNGWTAIYYAAKGGSVLVIEALMQAGLDLNARTSCNSHALHIAAENNNLKIVKYLIENNPSLTLLNDKNGWTAMHYAAQGGSTPVVDALIQAGLDLNARTNDDRNLLHISAENNNVPIVKYLIENNPSLTLQYDKDGCTAIHCAAAGGSAPVIEALSQAGLDLKARTNDDSHVLHIAAANGNLPIVKYLIENNPSLTQQNDKNGWSVIHYTAAKGSVPVIEALIQAGLDVNARTSSNSHVLHIAARYDNMPIVKYLIENNPSLTLQNDNNGWTAIHYASAGGSVPVIEALIQAGLHINARTNDDRHVLHIAALNDNLPIVKYLVENSPSLTLQNDKHGWSAIHYAVARGSAPVTETLIQAGLDLNARTNDDSHVMHLAAQYSNLPVVKYLIENNASLTLQNSNDGWTAIHYAASRGSIPVIVALMEAGLDLNARTSSNSHVLHIAARYDNMPIVKYLIENNPSLTLQNDKNGWTAIHYAGAGGSVPVIEALIQAGLDINARTNDDRHVLHIAAANNNLPIVKYMIQNNPSLTLKNDKNGWTAIHYAAAGGSAPVIEALIQAGLDINARTNDDRHVLHIAAQNDNLPIVKYLVENSPSLTLQNDKNGWSALHYAAAGGSAPVIEALKQAGLDLNARTNDDRNVLHIAARNDNLPIVKYLIENNPSLTLQHIRNGWTAIHYAAIGGSAPVIEALIQAGLDHNAKADDDFHALHIAALANNLPIVKYLIENNPSLTLQSNKNGLTAIHCAALGGSVSMIESLIRAGLDLSLRTSSNIHVLHLAALNDNLPIVKYLIENNPSLILQNDRDGWTAIHYAVKGGSTPVVDALIKAGLDLNARTNDDCNVLHIAAGTDNLLIVKYLIEKNPTLKQQNNKYRWRPIHCAAAGGSATVTEALILAGLDFNVRTNDDSSLLHIAAANGNLSIVKYLIEKNPILTLQNNKYGWTAIHYAAQRGSAAVIVALIQEGLDLNARTNNDSHVLHIAALNDNLPVVKYLIENSPSLTQQNDNNGWTAIHYAAVRGSVPVIEALIKAGLDLNARTNDDKDALHIAAQYDNISIIKFLIETNPS